MLYPINQRVLFIDHYDSFSAMIADYCRQLQQEVIIYKTDELAQNLLAQVQPQAIIIGPGPGHPQSPELQAVYQIIRSAINLGIPVLGICLGHQILAAYFGGTIIQSPQIAHGMVSAIQHYGTGIFRGLPYPMQVTRYHSLSVAKASLERTSLRVTAWTSSDEVMALEHKELALFGVQFHPESVLSVSGLQLLEQFFLHSKT